MSISLLVLLPLSGVLAQWQAYPVAGWGFINAVSMADSLHGMAGGVTGSGVYTTDGWKSFRFAQFPQRLAAIAQVTPSLAWSVGAAGAIYRSMTGGRTWTAQVSGVPDDLIGVSFADQFSGWAVGRAALVLHTSDGGVTWVRQFPGFDGWYENVFAVSPSNAWIATGEGILLSTTNGGRSWVRTTVNPSAALYSVYFATPRTGWAGGGLLDPATCASDAKELKVLYRTTDGGVTWLSQRYRLPADMGRIRSIHASDSSTVWVTGYSYTAYPFPSSMNAGMKWSPGPSVYAWGDLHVAGSRSLNNLIACDSRSLWNSQDGGMTWNGVNTSLEGLTATSSPDGRNGWVVGDKGKILHTSDRGRSWEVQTVFGSGQSPIEPPLRSVSFVDSLWGWAAGDTLLHTTDGGTSWAVQAKISGATLGGVQFLDRTLGWATTVPGTPPTFSVTTNGGAAWTDLHANIVPEAFQFLSATQGYAVAQTFIYKTTDGGRSWTWLRTTKGPARALFFLDDRTGWVVGDDNEMLKTSDGGSSWTLVPPVQAMFGYARSLRTVWMRSPSEVWVAGFSDLVFMTTDGGMTWNNVYPPGGASSNYLLGMCVRDPGRGWVVGGNVIFDVVNQGVSSPIDTVDFPPDTTHVPGPTEFALSCNFPNPFNGGTQFEISLPTASNVTFTVYDLLGQQVAVLFDGPMAAGIRTIPWTPRDLPSGIYLCRFQSDRGWRETRKVLLLH